MNPFLVITGQEEPLILPRSFIMPQVEKVQPWKAGWLARNAPGATKTKPAGTSHGTKKGETVVQGGFTSGVAIKMTPDKAQ